MKREIEVGFNWFHYLVVFYIVAGLVIGGGLYWVRSRVSKSDFDNLISTSSKWQQLSDDPCKFQIQGEPTDSGKNYVKISLKCKSSHSDNTLALNAINPNTLKAVIKTLAEVNMFDATSLLNSEHWECKLNGQVINMETIVRPMSQINCYEN